MYFHFNFDVAVEPFSFKFPLLKNRQFKQSFKQSKQYFGPLTFIKL